MVYDSIIPQDLDTPLFNEILDENVIKFRLPKPNWAQSD